MTITVDGVAIPEQAIAREQRRVAALTQRLIDRASRAIDDKEFDVADSALREADSFSPGSAAAVDLRRRLARERAAAEVADLLHQMCVEEIRRARSVFRRGRYDEAVQQLRGFLEVEPDAQEAAHELEPPRAARGVEPADLPGVARVAHVDGAQPGGPVGDEGQAACELDVGRRARGVEGAQLRGRRRRVVLAGGCLRQRAVAP